MGISCLIDQTNIGRGLTGLHITNTQSPPHKSIRLIRIPQQIHNFIRCLVQLINGIAIPMFFPQEIQPVAIPEFRRIFRLCRHVPWSMIVFLNIMAPINSDKKCSMERINYFLPLFGSHLGCTIHPGVHAIVYVHQIGNHFFCNRDRAGTHIQQYGADNILLIIRHYHIPL